MRSFPYILVVGLLLLALGGCQDDIGTSDLTFNIVNQLTGDPVIGAEVRLVTNGLPGNEFEGVDTNRIVIPDVPPDDDYSVLVPAPIGTAPVWLGPFRVSGNDRTFEVEVLTYQQLLDTYGVAQPTNGSVTLVVFGYDRFGGTPLEVAVDVDNGQFTGTGTPAVVTAIQFPPAIHDVTVTATASGRTVTFPGMIFLGGNSVQVVRVSFAEAR